MEYGGADRNRGAMTTIDNVHSTVVAKWFDGINPAILINDTIIATLRTQIQCLICVDQ